MSELDLFGHVSTGDTGARSDLDFYETPKWMTRSLLTHYPDIAGTRVLECCSGNDAIAEVLRTEAGCTVFTNDINRLHPAQTHFDATHSLYWQKHAPDVDYVITNVAFNVAFDILKLAVRHPRWTTIFLLRKTFLEPTEDRGLWLTAHPLSFQLCEPRHSFRGEGSDSVSCDWMGWPGRVSVHSGRDVSTILRFDPHAKERTFPWKKADR